MRYERYADEFAAIMCQNFQIIILENENLISVAIYSIRHLCNEIFLLRLLDMSGMKANEKIVKNKKTVEPEGRKKKPQKSCPTHGEWKCYTIPSKHMWIVFFHVSDEESGVQVPAFVFFSQFSRLRTDDRPDR